MKPRRLHKLTIFSMRCASVTVLIGTELTADYADVADNTEFIRQKREIALKRELTTDLLVLNLGVF